MTQENFQADKIIYQGQISYGSQTQLTYLGSCVSVILFSRIYEFAALSHIVGYNTKIGKYNYPHEVLDYYKNHFASTYSPFDYYIIGGSDRCTYVLDQTREELHRRQIEFKELDVLRNYYRRVFVDPINQEVKLFKKDLFAALSRFD